jgi:hypothetical protein
MNGIAAGLDGTDDLHLFILIPFSSALLVELIVRITRNLKNVLFPSRTIFPVKLWVGACCLA